MCGVKYAYEGGHWTGKTLFLKNPLFFQVQCICKKIFSYIMSEHKTLYDVLGVKPNVCQFILIAYMFFTLDYKAQSQAIQAAYDTLVEKYQKKEISEGDFGEITNAYNTLIDEGTRAEYDKSLTNTKPVGNALRVIKDVSIHIRITAFIH